MPPDGARIISPKVIDQFGPTPCYINSHTPSPIRALNLAGHPFPHYHQDMSDYKAINTTIKVYPIVKFCISPGEAGQFVFSCCFLLRNMEKCSLSHIKNTNMSCSWHI